MIEGAIVDRGNTLEHARLAQTAWAQVAVARRLEIIRRLRRSIAENAGVLAAAVDGAKKRRPGETLAAEVLPLAEACRFLERRARRILKPRRLPRYALFSFFAGVRVEVRREPFGVILVIGPSNYPLFLPGVQALQALAAGNAVYVKPGAGGAEACNLLARLLTESGLDERLLTVCSESVGDAQAVIAAGADKVILTGSAETGRAVLGELAPRLVPSTMELSGCDAVFVLGGADAELVVRALAFGLSLNSGATCIAPRRVFVVAGAAPELETRLAEEVRSFPPCHPDEHAAARARELAQEAVSQGAACLTPLAESAESCRPIIVTGASPGMRLLQEDVAAPVLSVVRVSDEDAAVRAADECPYALGATVFGETEQAVRFAGRVNAGVVVVNDIIVPTADPRVPFGGRKRSGFGVTRGAEGLLEMTQPKAILVRTSGRRRHLEAGFGDAERILRAYLDVAHGRSGAGRCRALWRMLKLTLAGRQADGEEKAT